MEVSAASNAASGSPRLSHYKPCLSPEDAVTYYSHLLSERAGTSMTQLQRAKAYVQLGNYDAACRDLNDWMQHHTGPYHIGTVSNAEVAAAAVIDARFYRGICLARLSRVEEALEDFVEVLRCEPARSRAMYERAACEARLGDFSAAVLHYDVALRMDEVGKERAPLLRHRQRRQQQQRQFEQQRREREQRVQQGNLLETQEREEFERRQEEMQDQQEGDHNKERELQEKRERQRPRQQRSHTPLSSTGTAMASPPSATRSPLQAFVDGPLPSAPSLLPSTRPEADDAKEATQRSPPSIPGLFGNSSGSRRASLDVCSDSAFAAVSLSESTMPVNGPPRSALFGFRLGSRQNSLSRYALGVEEDELTGVSSSTATSRSTSSRDAGAAPTEAELDVASAMDPTCVLSSASDIDEDLDEGGRSGTSPSGPTRQTSGTGNSPNVRSPASASLTMGSAAYYYQRGLQLRRRGDWMAAISLYTEALAADRSHFKSLFNRAFCYDRIGQYDKAVRDYKNAAQLEPKNAFTYYNLGISQDHRGHHKHAVEAFSRAIELDGTHPDFYHNRGFSQRKRDRFDDAIADYTQAIAIDAGHFKSYYNRAYCYSQLGRYEEAVADYSAALRIDGSNPNAYHNRGAALEKLGRLEAAIKDFTHALERSPSLTVALNARGLAYDQMKSYDKALADFDKAVELDPRNPAWLHNRGFTLRNMGELSRAVDDYTASIALAPNSFTAFNNRAFALRKLGRFAEAAKDYTMVLQLHPPATVKALNNRAYCLARLDDFAAALRDYTSVLAIEPTNAHALYNRGISREKCGAYAEAVSDFTAAIDLAPGATTSANAFYSRGTARLQLKQVPLAVADLRQALRLDSLASRLRGNALKEFQAEHPAWQLLQDLGITR